jgi:hypothetical protein
MSERVPYSRVYWSVADDPKFVGVYDDDSALALWLRLLMSADALWPAPAPLPRSARPKPLAKLVDAGIIDLLPGDRYRVHGLEAERQRRASAAKRDPNGTQTGPKREARGSLDETRRDELSQAETPRDPAEAYWSLTGKYPAGRVLSWIDELAATYGPEPTIRAVVKAHGEDRNAGTLLGRAQDHLRAEARELDRQERTEEQARLAAKRSIPRVEEPWRVELRAAIERQYKEAS